ncbi:MULTISPECIES: hypothetical protein [unclassified Aureispira]|uniref:hypothetical protein n=1 Tax=unclassified Aureispira TaxID=2649989 RepID=UPI00069647D3|nr:MULTISPECIES: hypothetical protein [unclassified Aureispira]WMX16191.1 hypothetical protein QP953_07420 [Aureispira sp. CCB-E]
MKRLFILTILSIISFLPTTQAQEDSYAQDAVQLAARLVANQSTGEISEHLVYSIEDALVAIAQSPYVAATAVAHQYRIHTSPTANVSNIRIILGREAEWSEAISENPIQKIFPNYEFSLSVVETTDAYVVLDLSSVRAINMKFIASQISYLDHVWMVELPSADLNKDDIRLKEIEGGYVITYIYHTGSCEGACGDTHYWDFEVEHNGTVTFLGEHGADLSINSLETEENFYSLLKELRP